MSFEAFWGSKEDDFKKLTAGYSKFVNKLIIDFVNDQQYVDCMTINNQMWSQAQTDISNELTGIFAQLLLKYFFHSIFVIF